MSPKIPYPVKVIFRKWPDGTIDALMPYEGFSPSCNCTVYSHIGQHSGGDYEHCVRQTEFATPEEFAPLKCELEAIGYQVEVVYRKQYRRTKSGAWSA